MGAAKAHQGIGGVAKAQQRSPDFQIKVRLVAARNVSVAQVHDRRQKRASECQECERPRC